MKLYHTSPVIIESIKENGTFGSSLCFSTSPYYMSEAKIIYTLDVEESEIIEASSFFYQDNYEVLNDLVASIVSVCEVDEDTAQDILAGKETTGDYENDWWVQGLMGTAAKLLGYKAAQANDEQGAVYIVDMFGKESALGE